MAVIVHLHTAAALAQEKKKSMLTLEIGYILKATKQICCNIVAKYSFLFHWQFYLLATRHICYVFVYVQRRKVSSTEYEETVV